MRDDIKPGEILEILKEKIAGFEPATGEIEIGKVMQAGDGIAQVWGLESIMSGEFVEIDVAGDRIVTGIAMNLEEETVGIILFSDYDLVKEGCTLRRTNPVVEVPARDALLGLVVDSLGHPVDVKEPVKTHVRRRVETKGPGIVDRMNIVEPLRTGIKAVDAMIPIQRELIIGDRRTGKTTIAIDTILNQKQANECETVYCFYVAIG
jgi:F-type H+-transporting ATPase subunit alpha